MQWKKQAVSVAIGIMMMGLGARFAYAETATKIAVVDLQYALNNTQEGKTIKTSLQKESEEKKQQLALLENDLKKMQDDIQKQRMVLSEDALKEKMEVFKKRYGELQQKAMEFEKELGRKEADNAERILGGLQGIVAQIAKDKQYTLVLEKSRGAVVYGDSSIPDITNELVEAYNKNPPKAKK